MNAERRKALKAVAARLEAITDEFGSIYEDLEMLRDEEMEYFEAMPEGFQSGQRGEASQEAMDLMNMVLDSLDSIRDGLEAREYEDLENL